MLYRMVLQLPLLISIFVVFIALPDEAYSGIDESVLATRNQINSGDYSTNIIASGNSRVYIFLDEHNRKIRRTEESVVAYVKEHEPDRIREARTEFPSGSADFIARVAVAEHVFAQQQFSLSASLYKDILDDMDHQQSGYISIENMVTNSYFASARHMQGLRFICKQYTYRPKWDHRFRHAVHAHVRALVAHFDHQYAEQALNAIRRDPHCNRADFTNAWIPIHLYDMRALEQGTPYWEYRYGMSNSEDVRYAEKLLLEGGHGFEDYILFVLGRFEELIQRFPSSYIYDLAILGIAKNSESDRSIELLVEYLERFGAHNTVAFDLLIRRAWEKGGEQLAAIYRERFSDSTNKAEGKVDNSFKSSDSDPLTVRVSLSSRVWIYNPKIKAVSWVKRQVIADYYSSCFEFEHLFHEGEYAKLQDSLNKWKQIYENTFENDLEMQGYFSQSDTEIRNNDFWGKCLVDFSPQKISTLLDVFAQGAEAQRSFDAKSLAEFGIKLKLCGDARDSLRKQTLDCDRLESAVAKSSISFHRSSASLLKQAFELSGRSDSRSLFLSGLAYRHANDFKSFIGVMEQYAKNFPKGDFADDALTEIGWFNLVIRGDTDEANRYFQKVVNEYKEKNAYDNALNWLIISKRISGKYIEALRLSTTLLGTVVSDRLSQITKGRHQEIRQAADIIGKSNRIVIGEDYNKGGFAIYSGADVVVRWSTVPELPTGSRIYSVQNVSVLDANDFLKSLVKLKSEGIENVDIEYILNGDGEYVESSVSIPIWYFFDKSSVKGLKM